MTEHSTTGTETVNNTTKIELPYDCQFFSPLEEKWVSESRYPNKRLAAMCAAVIREFYGFETRIKQG